MTRIFTERVVNTSVVKNAMVVVTLSVLITAPLL